MLEVGDKVSLKGRPEVEGEVIEKEGGWAYVKYSGDKWAPPKDWHYYTDLVKIGSDSIEDKITDTDLCECGAKYTEFPTIHMHFCLAGRGNK